jgi:hypothetical protein
MTPDSVLSPFEAFVYHRRHTEGAMPTTALSDAALTLLFDCLEGPVPVTGENRQAYGELEEAGIMYPLHTPKGRNTAYRFTESGWAAYGLDGARRTVPTES